MLNVILFMTTFLITKFILYKIVSYGIQRDLEEVGNNRKDYGTLESHAEWHKRFAENL